MVFFPIFLNNEKGDDFIPRLRKEKNVFKNIRERTHVEYQRTDCEKTPSLIYCIFP